MATETQKWCVRAYSRILAQFLAILRLMKQYDVVIVGGGIHGAGVLQAAAAAGHSALLIERFGLASGTSSRSSKLIHGGLRYLESGPFPLGGGESPQTVHTSPHRRGTGRAQALLHSGVSRHAAPPVAAENWPLDLCPARGFRCKYPLRRGAESRMVRARR